MHAEAFAPYTPLNVLKPVGERIWIVDGPEIRFGVLGFHFPFPTRMTVVQLNDGGVWLHSPTEPTEDLARAVRDLGPVRWLVAPNTIHYWWIPAWKSRFPDAELFGPPGLESSAKRPLPSYTTLRDSPPPDWDGEIGQTLIRGDVLTEADFFHQASRTLILTDLIENFEPARTRKPWLRLMLRWSGAADPDGKAPIDMQLSFVRQRRQLREVVRRMIDWAPERIILAHGRWYDRNGTEELKRAFRWVLQPAPYSSA
ncbi:MAG: DUF4336 domain-containing protein [Alphaproteobacteria bacterium]|nr:DUF4336 domain-containing protein [Alphaproteobacteria bacterium]